MNGQATAPSVPPASGFVKPTFTEALQHGDKRKLPQCIAHRGYRARHPENTLLAFRSAIEAGAHAIETDVHLTKDDVVIISHDPSLKRCFNRPEKIVNCDWDDIKGLRTTKAPHEPMPRLQDVLTLLSDEGNEHVWCLLDIKMDDDPDRLIRLIGSTIAAHSPSAKSPWSNRIVLGIWAAKYLPLCLKYLPGFPVMHIGFKGPYAEHFLDIDNIGFNMLFPTLVAPGGLNFLDRVRGKYHRQVIAWTVNDQERMDWCIRHELDGVITDDPKHFLTRCDEYNDNDRETSRILPLSIRGMFDVVRIWIMITFLMWWLGKKFLPVASQELIRKVP